MPGPFVPSNKGDGMAPERPALDSVQFCFMITGVMAANYKLSKVQFFILIIKRPR